jgi:hypothetical protein
MSRETIIMVIAQECFPDSPDGHGGYDGLLHAEKKVRVRVFILS